MLADFQKLNGCGCKAAGERPAIDLYARADGTTTLITNGGVSVEHAFVFALASGPDDLHVLATTDATAPATAYRRNFITISMGCLDDLVVVAAGEHVSAWSRAAGTLAWSQRLPEAHEGFRSEPRDDVVLDCSRLTPKKSDVPVRAGRRTVRLALADGTMK